MTRQYREYDPSGSLAEFLERVKTVRGDLADQKGDKVDRVGEEHGIWFRGQPSSSLALMPEIYREPFKGAQEAEIRQEFQARALQLVQGRHPTMKWQWYFLMRHYGAPTRLLDWTDNPMVALFFAVDEAARKGFDPRCDACVWAVNPWSLNELLKGDKRLKRKRIEIKGPMLPEWEEADEWLPDLEEAFATGDRVKVGSPAAIDPPHIDRRVAAQGSRFVIFGTNKDMRAMQLQGSKRKRRQLLGMLPIPGSKVRSLNKELALAGVTHSSLFPDLPGLSEEIRRKWRKNKR